MQKNKRTDDDIEKVIEECYVAEDQNRSKFPGMSYEQGVKAGIDAKVLIDIINAGSGRNSATQDKFPKAILTRTFDFGFATGLSYKDVRLCLEESEALGVPMVAGAAVRQMLAITNAKFGPESDFTSIAKVVEEWAGVEIKG
mgnify:CR=1 FL=1